MNIPLLREIQQTILSKPGAFDMVRWFTKSDVAPCGTAACIGGWAVTLAMTQSKLPKDGEQIWEGSSSALPEVLLELTADQEDRLLYHSSWPEKYFTAYNKAKDQFDYLTAAQIASDRIDHFIETEGRE